MITLEDACRIAYTNDPQVPYYEGEKCVEFPEGWVFNYSFSPDPETWVTGICSFLLVVDNKTGRTRDVYIVCDEGFNFMHKLGAEGKEVTMIPPNNL